MHIDLCKRFGVAIVATVIGSGCTHASSEAPAGPSAQVAAAPLIPRSTFYGNPEHTHLSISPDGRWFTFLAPVDGVLSVMLAPSTLPIDFAKARPLTAGGTRPILDAQWTRVPDIMVFTQDANGDENSHIFSINLTTGKTQDLTPYKGADCGILGFSDKYPDELLAQINDRDPKNHDVYRVNLKTGQRTLVFKNEPGFGWFEVDDDLKVRLAFRMPPDGSKELYAPGPSGAFDRLFTRIPFEDALATGTMGISADGKSVYLLDTRDRETAALVSMDLTSGKLTVISADPHGDTVVSLADPRTHKPLIATAEYDRKRDIALVPEMQTDIDYLKTVMPGADVTWGDCTDDMSRCIVYYTVSDGPAAFYVYDRVKHHADLAFVHRPKLLQLTLAAMHTLHLKSRDGLELLSYLSLPPGSDPSGAGHPTHPLPLVLDVHGGPWARDEWGYDREHQWLANRGYAVLSVNFRGSWGLGKSFLNAGNREWGAKMQDDLVDAVKWAVDNGLADPKRIAIYGASYGGYAALAGLTQTPELFACGVDKFGPSNLITLQQNYPADWESVRAQMFARIGDPRTEEGKKFLLSRSPATHVAAITKPLLIGQGQNDARVTHVESEQVVSAMKAKNIPVTYVLFSDEGHGFQRPENEQAFDAIAEQFLAKCLGGSAEPIGSAFTGSSIAVPSGAEQIDGLAAALAAKH